MTLRAYLANKLHALAYRIEPQAWYTQPRYTKGSCAGCGRPWQDSIANVEIVRDLGAGTFDVKSPRECRKYRGLYPAGPCPATECEYPNCISDGFVSRYAVKPTPPPGRDLHEWQEPPKPTPLQRKRAAKPQPPVLTPGKGG